jgi:serine/threonine-protein kinase
MAGNQAEAIGADEASAEAMTDGVESIERPSAAAAAAAPSSGGEQDASRSLLSELRVGTVIEGKYQVDAILGRGAMGVVVAATHVHLKERVALKFLLVRGDSDHDFKSRFRREAQVCARLRNEHIARVIDVGTWKDTATFMVMEYLAGTDLRKVLRARGQLDIPTALDYTVQICEGLAEAHAQNIIHRDLKPSNLFVTKRADGSDLIKILDFGISKWSEQHAGDDEIDELTRTGMVLGSPKYMSPEQLFGSSGADARSDVWSIGAILYEMLAGRPPYDEPTFARLCAELANGRGPAPVRQLRADIPPELEAVIMRCFEREREVRVQNVAELAAGVLAAVGAPFADQVHQKISATLASGSPRELTSTTGGVATSLGLSLSGSIPRATMSTGSSQIGTMQAPNPRSKHLAIAAALAGVAIVATAWVVKGSSPPPSAAPVQGEMTLTGQPPSAAPQPTTAVDSPAAATAKPEAELQPAAANDVPKEPTKEVPPRPEPVRHVTPQKPVWRPPTKPAGNSGTAAAPAPEPAPAPAPMQPAAPEPPKKKINPLEDRQ